MAKQNLILFGIDSLWSDHMSCYGYNRLTTPHIDKFATQGVLFENTFSAHIPTTPAYASMLTGMDCFSTDVVALRHRGGLTEDVTTLPEILSAEGYQSLGKLGRAPPAQSRIAQRSDIARTGTPGRWRQTVFPIFATHGSARALFAAATVRFDVLQQRPVRPVQNHHGTGKSIQAISRFSFELDAAGHYRRRFCSGAIRR